MKKLIIGTGTGRCGTKSLAKLLGLQEGTRATHEKHGGLDRRRPLGEYLDDLEASDEPVVADVNPGYGSHPDLHREWLNRRFSLVWLHRPLHEYLRSSMRHSWNHGAQKHNNEFLTDPGKHGYRVADYGWQNSFPKFDELAGFPQEVIYTHFWNWCERISREFSHENGALHMHTHDLNHPEAVRDLLVWLGYSNPNVVTKIQIR